MAFSVGLRNRSQMFVGGFHICVRGRGDLSINIKPSLLFQDDPESLETVGNLRDLVSQFLLCALGRSYRDLEAPKSCKVLNMTLALRNISHIWRCSTAM